MNPFTEIAATLPSSQDVRAQHNGGGDVDYPAAFGELAVWYDLARASLQAMVERQAEEDRLAARRQDT